MSKFVSATKNLWPEDAIRCASSAPDLRTGFRSDKWSVRLTAITQVFSESRRYYTRYGNSIYPTSNPCGIHSDRNADCCFDHRHSQRDRHPALLQAAASQSNFSELGLYQAARAEPAIIPGTQPTDFDIAGSDYAEIGWAPEGRVYFSYAIEIAEDASGFTADAAADIDGDGVVQIWGYTKPSGTGDPVAGVRCALPNQLIPEIVGSCLLDSSIF
jgi:hypothetical protein